MCIRLWFCACIPCIFDECTTVTHKCPECKGVIGRYEGGI